jgi:hypothetical protein
MWQPAARRHSGDPAGAPVPNLVLLPPTIGRGVDGAPATDDPAPPAEPGAAPRYLLATPVPGNWVPLLPVQLDDHGTLVTRLKRGACSSRTGPTGFGMGAARSSPPWPCRRCTTRRSLARALT